MQSGPWPKEGDDRGVRRIPAALVAGGQGRGAREHEKVEANLWVGLDGARDG